MLQEEKAKIKGEQQLMMLTNETSQGLRITSMLEYGQILTPGTPEYVLHILCR